MRGWLVLCQEGRDARFNAFLFGCRAGVEGEVNTIGEADMLLATGD